MPPRDPRTLRELYYQPTRPEDEDHARAVRSFNERAEAAVRDPELHAALADAVDHIVARRTTALTALPAAGDLRAQAYAAKREVMQHLDTYLAMAADAIERAGGKVFFARDADEAVAYVADLVAAKNARSVVKSKSMVTEEIQLNARLEAQFADLDVVETDLGEWIAQLAHEHPSHIIAPIIHMNRFRIAEVLSREAGRAIPPTVEDLMGYARARLRQEFLRADIGISGANFLVAETGTLALVTNEGNGRLITSLPRVHVAITGIEKLIPRFADLDTFLRLLARSGTGQPLTVYTHLITGPRRATDADGPDELHVVLVDSGRSALLATQFEEALFCIRCGACLNVCPVYRQVGGHVYDQTYAGPIGAVISPLLRPRDPVARELPFASSLCGACSETCPVGIPLHELLLKLRAREVSEPAGGAGSNVSSPVQNLLFGGFGWAARSPLTFGAATTMARAAQAPFVRDGWIESAPGPLAAWTEYRDLPQVARKTFHQRWKEELADGEPG